MTRSRTVRGSVLALAAAFVMSACAAHPGCAPPWSAPSASATRQVDDVARARCARRRAARPADGAAAAGAGQPGRPPGCARRADQQRAVPPVRRVAGRRSPTRSRSPRRSPPTSRASTACPPSQPRGVPRDPAGVRRGPADADRDRQAASWPRPAPQNVTEQQAVSEGTKLRNAWAAKNARRLGRPALRRLRPRTRCWPRAARCPSPRVRSAPPTAAAPTRPPGWVASLPASQKCG